MASTDARPVPIKNTAFRAVFPLLDADGDLVTGATGLDSEVSQDQGTFADCTNEATEIATSSGMYYLDLTSTEMNADCVAVIVKTSTSGAKTTVLVFYPVEAGDIDVDVTAWNGTAVSSPATAGIPEVNVKNINNVSASSVTTVNANQGTTQPINFTGTGASALAKSDMVDVAGAAVSTSTAQLGVNVVNFGGSAGTFASGRPEVNTTHAAGTAWGSGAITAASIASAAITAAKFGAGAIDAAAIADGAIDRATFAADTGLQTIRSNTAQSGAAGSITLDASASATTDFYKGAWILITGGTGVGQTRLCTAYNGTSKVATITPNWATNPDATSTFAVLPAAGVDLELIKNAAVSTSTAQLGVNAVQAGGTAWGSGAITAAAIASNAITSAKIASGAITSTGIAASAIGASQLATGAITNAKFAAGAIDAAAIAADAIGASELAADAATEIGTAVWATAARTLTAATNITSTGGTTVPQTGDSYARLGAPAGASVSADVAAVKTDTGNILTKLLKYVQLLVRKDAAIATDNATELTAINANGGSGAGSFDNTTDSEQALRDRGDAAWITATGFSTLDAAGVRTAVGLASANLDTQLTAIDDYIDTEVAAIKAKTDLIPASPAATSDIPSAATIADAVWDEALSGHTTAGSGGKALSDIDTHTDTEVASILAAVDTEVAAIKAKTDQLTFTTANQVDATTMSMAANALTAAATASDFGTEVATAVWASATRTLSALGFTLSASDLAADTIGASELAADAVTEIVNAVLTTAMTESYNADGAAPTLAQAMFLCMQRLTEFAISGTTVTVKKLDGSTTAYTLTLDDATSPTSSTRAT